MNSNLVFHHLKIVFSIVIVLLLALTTHSVVYAVTTEEAPSLVDVVFNPTSGVIPGYFYKPSAIAINKTNNIFYVYDNSNVVVKFDLLGNQYDGFGGGGQNKLGSEDGRLAAVGGMAIDSNGNIYTSDTTRNRIQKFDSEGNFITKWGSTGTGNGQLSGPLGIAVDSLGNVYVADGNNSRIQKFDSNGNYITKWGSVGVGDGQFLLPQGIAVDSSNNVYVIDLVFYRVQKFTSSGAFLAKWGSYGTTDGKFTSTTAIAIDSQNNIYVVDSNRIQKFDSSGNFSTKWGSVGTENGQFSSPSGVSVDSLNNIYVTDTSNNRIQKFNSSGIFQNAILSKGSENGQFFRPFGLARDVSNNFYVVDASNKRIQKFDLEGNYISKWGSSGSGNGQFSGAMGIAIDSSGNTYVAEQGNNRVQKFDSNGDFLTKWGSSGSGNGQFNNPVMVAVDTSNNIYVADSNNKRIQKFDSDGAYITSLSFPNAVDGIAFDIYGNMFTSDYGCIISKFDSSLSLIKSFGACGIADGQFYEPTGVSTDSYGNVYVMDYANNRVQEFDNDGNYITKWGSPGSAEGNFNGPAALVIDHLNRIIVADTNNNRIQIFKDITSPTISSPLSSASLTGANITWTTSEKASTKVVYGISSSYVSTTIETDTLPKVNNHAVVLSDLKPCTTYHYQLRSKDSVANEKIDTDRTFTTLGCTGSATVVGQTASEILKSLGGTMSLLDGNSHGLELTIPSGASMYDADFQLKQLEKAPVISAISTPSGYSAIGSYIYDLKAYADMDTTVSEFDKDLEISISYASTDINGISETSLRIYTWDGSSWSRLPNCFVNIFANTVTCSTDHFSLFGLFGRVASAQDVAEEEITTQIEEDADTDTNTHDEEGTAQPIEEIKSSDLNEDENKGTNWKNILIYSGIGLVVVFVGIIVLKKREY